MSTAMIEPADDEVGIDPVAPIGQSATIRDLIATPQFQDVVVHAGQSGSDDVVEGIVWWDEHGVGACDGALVVLESRGPVPAYRLEAGLHEAKAGGAVAVLLLGSPGRPVVSTTRLADRLGLPLLSVDRADPRSYSHSLAVAIRSPEVARAQQLTSLVRALRARHRTGEAVLRTFRQVVGLQATVVAGDGSLLIGDPVDIPPAARLDHQVPQQVPVERGVLVLHPVQTKALRGGEVWLVATVPTDARPWVESTTDLLTVLEPTIAAWLVDERLGAERNSRFRSRLLTELISGGDGTSQRVAQQAVAAGWQLLGWHTGFFLGMSDAGLGGARRDVVLMQTERVRRVLHSAKLTNEVVELQDGWASWITGQSERSAVDKAELLDLLGRALGQLPHSWRAHAGVGRPHGGISGLAATLAEARDAASLGRTQPAGHRVVHIDELGAARIMTAVRQSSDAVAYANSLLSPLRHVNGGLLLDTLRVYLDNRSSLGLTADALNLHRNTVSGRLARIRQLLGVDLDDPEERLSLSLACRIAEAEA